jgi:hypothetical protein
MSILFLLLTASGTPASPAKAVDTPWPLPWKENVSYEFVWHLTKTSSATDREGPNGTTTFSLRRDPKRPRITCKAELRFRDGAATLNCRFFSVYSADLRPRFFASRTSGGRPGNTGGGVGTTAAFGDTAIAVRRGASKKATTDRVAVPEEPFWLYGHQAIHHWAIFLPFLDTAPGSLAPAAPKTMKVFMPDILRFITITFTPDGTEETRGVEATRWKFNAEGLFSGKVWLGPDRRLLRYQQRLPDGHLDIWIKKKT